MRILAVNTLIPTQIEYEVDGCQTWFIGFLDIVNAKAYTQSNERVAPELEEAIFSFFRNCFIPEPPELPANVLDKMAETYKEMNG
jgi:hypothetical protein